MKKDLPEALQKKAWELLRHREKVDSLSLGCVETDDIPSTGKTLYKIDAFKTGSPNGSRYNLILNENGKEVDLNALSKQEGKTFFATKSTTLPKIPVPIPSAAITIQPTENILVLNPDATIDETITVTVPSDAGIAKVDVYFLADTTGSMHSILSSVQIGSNNPIISLTHSMGWV